LHAITLSAELLMRGRLLSATEQSEMGRRIATSSARAQRLVNDLTEFARGRLGAQPELSIQQCDMREIVRDTIDELRAVHP